MTDVIVVIGAGQIGQAIARRVGVGKRVLLSDMRPDNARGAADVLGNAGYEVSVATVDASSREAVRALVATATKLGDVTGLVHAAGVSPTQASPETIFKVDLYGTALVLEEFGKAIARGGAGVVISSQSGHRLPPLTVVAGRAGTPDEVGTVGALLMGQDGGFITGSDFLMDGGVTAGYWYGGLAEVRA